MRDIDQLVTTMGDSERQLLVVRTAAVDYRAARLRALLVIGGPVLMLLIGVMAWLLYRSIARLIDNLLDAVKRFGAGAHVARATTDQGSNEFRHLSKTYNDMAERLMRYMTLQVGVEGQLARINTELVERGQLMERRQHSIELLSEMSHRLQAIQNGGELATVLDCFLARVFLDLAGPLYIFNHSRNMLVRLSSWGIP